MFQLICLFTVMLTCPGNQVVPAATQKQSPISVEDLVTKVVVIGRLNVPLRQVVAIDAEWRAPNPLAVKPDNRIKLHVTRIKGTEINKPVVFDKFQIVDAKGHSVDPKVGQKLKLHVYEDWVIKNYHPREYEKLLGAMPVGNQHQEATQLYGVIRSE